MYQVILSQDTLDDIEAACDWYEKQKEGLGNELINEINKSIKELSFHPDHYTYIHFLYRRIRAKRFPYYLMYEIREETVLVYQLYHAKQNNSLR